MLLDINLLQHYPLSTQDYPSDHTLNDEVENLLNSLINESAIYGHEKYCMENNINNNLAKAKDSVMSARDKLDNALEELIKERLREAEEALIHEIIANLEFLNMQILNDIKQHDKKHDGKVTTTTVSKYSQHAKVMIKGYEERLKG